MNNTRTLVRCAYLIAVPAATGWLAWKYVALKFWVEIASGLFVVLAVLAAAILIRLARPSPFSNPEIFTSENLDRYFDALTEVARRLSVILGVVGLSVFLLFFATIFVTMIDAPDFPPEGREIARLISAGLGTLLAFILLRFIGVVRGDIGFLRLQREITRDARRRRTQEKAAAVAAEPIGLRSAGGYGRVVNQ